MKLTNEEEMAMLFMDSHLEHYLELCREHMGRVPVVAINNLSIIKSLKERIENQIINK